MQKLKTREDIEVATTKLIDILQQAATSATPVKNSPRNVNNLPTHIKQLIAQKRRARARWQKTHTPEDRRLFNNATNKLRGALHELNNATFTAYIASLKREDRTIWRPIKSRKKRRTPLLPIRTNTRPPGPWTKSDTEGATLFANHLAEVYKPHDDTPDPEILRKLAIHAQHTEKSRAFTIGELKGVIKRLHPRKTPGPDLVTTLMLQKLPPEGLKAILHPLNAITRLEHWPKPLKQAKVIMILKPGKNPTDVASYRPISLLPVISKILEKLLLQKTIKCNASPVMDPVTSVWISKAALYNSSMSSAY